MSGTDVAAAVGAAEASRCRAVNARDWAALRNLLAEGFVYRHWHGRSDARDDWIGHLQDYVSYQTARESLQVDRYDDIAVVTGVLRNTIVREEAGAPTTSVISAVQIWSIVDGSWRERAHYSFKNQR